jgi:hypothetical protein
MGPAMKLGFWILEGHTPKPVATVQEWARDFERGHRQVALDRVGRVKVSTVFLGIDHNFSGKGPPLLFETMVFGGPLNETQVRTATWREAEEQHAYILGRVMHALALMRDGQKVKS